MEWLREQIENQLKLTIGNDFGISAKYILSLIDKMECKNCIHYDTADCTGIKMGMCGRFELKIKSL